MHGVTNVSHSGIYILEEVLKFVLRRKKMRDTGKKAISKNGYV
jgi:hypothetical protein